MNKNLRWKLITSFAVFIIFFAVGVYPIIVQRFPKLPAPAALMAQQLRLGLDLKGGVHLVLRVQTDDALRIQTTMTSEQIRDALRTPGVAVSSIKVTSPTTFRVEGVPADRDGDFRRVADDQAAQSYDRNAVAGGAYEFTMKPNIERDLRAQTVVQAQQTIERRVNELGVAEPNISTYGAAQDQLLVQMPGVTDVARAKEIIQSTALLELKIVEAGPAPTREALLQSYGGKAPEDMEVVSGSASTGDAVGQFYLVRKLAAVTGRDLRNAKPSLD